jgi:hypothetical protein
MARPRPKRSLVKRGAVCAVVVGAVGVLAPAPAQAHFILEAPACWMSQDSLGTPEKLGPCGNEGGGTPTGTVTTFQSGQTITVTINEVIFHPGHYRIALAEDPSQLPAEPPVTAGSTPCGTVPIESPAVYPVLADGVFEHTTQFTSPQSVQITLPSNVTCTKCTLQVIEFMSDHGLNVPGGCFYHHCADIALQSGPVPDGGLVSDAGGAGSDAGGTGSDAGTGAGPDASSGSPPGPEPSSGGGCGCSAPPFGTTPAVAGLGTLVMLATLTRRLRRRRPGRRI